MIQIQLTERLEVTLEAVTSVREEKYPVWKDLDGNFVEPGQGIGGIEPEFKPMIIISVPGGQIEVRDWTLKRWQEVRDEINRKVSIMSGGLTKV